MILFDLKCRNNHTFEAWFRDDATFKAQNRAGEITCPVCGERKIAKAPMAPHVARSKGGEDRVSKISARTKVALGALRQHIEENCDFVGEKFPEEARKIHYGEVAERNIYGEATDEEADGLTEEGIRLHRIPWLGRHDS